MPDPENSTSDSAPADPGARRSSHATAGALSRHLPLVEKRRFHFVRAAVVGLVAGVLALFFQWSLFFAENSRGWLLDVLHAHPAWGWTILPLISGVICSFVGWMTAKYAPEAAGSGIPHVKAVLLHWRTLDWRKLIPVKFIGGVLGIGAGFSLGREGPTVQLGASAGQLVSDILRVPRRSRAQLIACGAGAGLAAAFNAPLAGFIFVIEELRRELSPITYGTALIAAVSADVVARAFHGQIPSFHITGYPTPPLTTLPWVAVVGLLAGLGGVLFNRGLVGSLAMFQALPKRVPRWLRAGVVGVLIGLVAWWLPGVVGGGHGLAERILRGEFAATDLVPFVLLLFVAKFGLTLLSYGCGVPGGIFAPMLVLGAMLGLLVGQMASVLTPGLAGAPAAFAVIGMAAYFTAVVRAPLTGVVLIVEMTANYEQMFALAVACLMAYVVAERLGDTPIYEALLRRDLRFAGEAGEIEDDLTIVHKVIEPGSMLDGRRLRHAHFPAGCLLVMIRRAGREIVPDGETRLCGGDEIVAAISGNAAQNLTFLEDAARSG